MDERSVSRIITPTLANDGAGVRLKRSIATAQLDNLDPFFLFDNFGSENSSDYIAGFPMHPHRGIETITYMLDGRVEHKDSLGNQGTIGAGDVQWMTAGSGILHEEMPKLGGGRLDGFQIWVNLPRQLKMTKPRYQDVAAAKIPEVVRPDGVRVRVVAGEVEGNGTRVQGAVKEIFAGPTYLDVSLPPRTSFEQPIPKGHTGILYCFRGDLSVGGRSAAEGRKVASPRLAILSDGELVRAHAGELPARFLLLSAQPLREPYARWGPFVMNTEQEVREAIRELQTGRFIRA